MTHVQNTGITLSEIQAPIAQERASCFLNSSTAPDDKIVEPAARYRALVHQHCSKHAVVYLQLAANMLVKQRIDN